MFGAPSNEMEEVDAFYGASNNGTRGPPPTLANHGGPLETAPVTLVPVFYGTWSSSDPKVAQARALLAGLPSVSTWRVLGQYTTSTGARVTSNITLAPSVFPGAPFGTQWATDHAPALAATVSGGIPVIITSSEVSVPDLGTQWCGYHSATQSGGARTPFILVGDSSGLPGCFYPNGGLPFASTLWHEVAELLTDPFGDGWVNATTQDEIGDLCAWDFPPFPGCPAGYYVAPSGQRWNANISGNLYMLQSMWDPWRKKCSMGFEGSPPPARSTPPLLGQPSPPAPTWPDAPWAPGQPPPLPAATKPGVFSGISVALVAMITLGRLARGRTTHAPPPSRFTDARAWAAPPPPPISASAPPAP